MLSESWGDNVVCEVMWSIDDHVALTNDDLDDDDERWPTIAVTTMTSMTMNTMTSDSSDEHDDLDDDEHDDLR